MPKPAACCFPTCNPSTNEHVIPTNRGNNKKIALLSDYERATHVTKFRNNFRWGFSGIEEWHVWLEKGNHFCVFVPNR
jgi:hypothetical protein